MLFFHEFVFPFASKVILESSTASNSSVPTNSLISSPMPHSVMNHKVLPFIDKGTSSTLPMSTTLDTDFISSAYEPLCEPISTPPTASNTSEPVLDPVSVVPSCSITNKHPMVTRSKSSITKPKALLTTPDTLEPKTIKLA